VAGIPPFIDENGMEGVSFMPKVAPWVLTARAGE
jgi:hypothetical protein